MSHGKQFTLYTHETGPNGWKVAIVLEELGLTYESEYLDLKNGEQRGPEYTKINPNGRIPALVDHQNNDFVIWESNAVMTYLVEKYDPDHKISATSSNDKFSQLQWLFFQSSGQGPYFGQAAWFLRLHPEKVQSAIDRYQKEVLRVWGVLESVLSKREWLVGDKCTVADLSFVVWNIPHIVLAGYDGFDFARDFPAVYKWDQAMRARDSVRTAFAAREAILQVKSA